MPYATETDVLEIIDTALTADEITPFLAASAAMVADVCDGKGYGPDLLREIERWLAAHFLAIRDPRVTAETTGDDATTYEAGAGTSSEGLKATRYGQQALMLDYRGFLASVANRKGVCSLHVINFRTSP